MRAKHHYYAVEYTDHLMRRKVLISIEAGEHLATATRIYWGGGPSHTGTLADMVVLKDYGTDEDTAYSSFDVDFPPEPIDLDTYPYSKDIRGWLAPDGRLFRAEYMNHSGTALDLVTGYHLVAQDYRQPEDVLYGLGWICISLVIAMNCAYRQERIFKPTPEQVAMLRRLRELNSSFEHYRDEITEFLERYKVED